MKSVTCGVAFTPIITPLIISARIAVRPLANLTPPATTGPRLVWAPTGPCSAAQTPTIEICRAADLLTRAKYTYDSGDKRSY